MSEQHAPDIAPEAISEAEVFEQKRVRLEKREKLNALAGDDLAGGAYPVSVPVTTTIPAVRQAWGPTTRRQRVVRVNPKALEASHCPECTELIAPRNISAR